MSTPTDAPKQPLLTGAQIVTIVLILVNAYLVINGHVQLDQRLNTIDAQVVRSCQQVNSFYHGGP